jgi:pimeloyl-ACP methyl ester carboxylesterase
VGVSRPPRVSGPRATGARMPQPPDYLSISRQVLLVTGEQDSLREPGFGAKLRAEIPGASLHVTKNAGHCPHIEAPDEFNAVLSRFLREG